jgi:hypothetical protein
MVRTAVSSLAPLAGIGLGAAEQPGFPCILKGFHPLQQRYALIFVRYGVAPHISSWLLPVQQPDN